MQSLSSALDALADDLHALDDGALLDRTAALVRERNRLDAELAARCAPPTCGRRASATG